MKLRHQVSRAAIDLIKRFEGFRPKAVRLPDGRWMIGYGHTLSARQGAEVSETDAEALLIYDLIAIAHAVNEWVYTPLTQNQFDALCSFAFNLGLDNFRRSAVLRRLNEGALLQAACAMELWRKAEFEGEEIVIDALVRRRSAEKALFLTPPGGAFVPAPSPVLRPGLDADLGKTVPSAEPVEVTAPAEGDRITLKREEAVVLRPVDAEAGQSPAQAAAAQVTARLRTIFRDPLAETAPTEAPREPAPGTAGESVPPLVLVAPDEDEVAVTPEPTSRAEPSANDHAQPELFRARGSELTDELVLGPAEELSPPPLAATGPAEPPPIPRRHAPPSRTAVRPRSRGLAGLAALGALGLALFAFGLYWTLNLRAQGVETGSSVVMGWLAGLAGVACFSIAAYRLLDRVAHGDGSDRLEF